MPTCTFRHLHPPITPSPSPLPPIATPSPLTNAALLAVGVPPQGVLATEARGEGSLLEGVHDGVWGTEELLEDDPHA